MIKFLRHHRNDVIAVIIIAICASLVSIFYLKGNRLDTGYQDWMYHAYRALSLEKYGLLSWDNVWDNGISYWRGYQLFGAALTVVVSLALHVSITKAMLLLTALCYVLLHVFVYLAARTFKSRPSVAVIVTAMVLAMTHFWVIIGFYSTMYAAVLTPLILILWKKCSARPELRVWFAVVVGLSCYVHPLLAIAAGGLWLIAVILDSRRYYLRYALIELGIIILLAFFYWYTLLLVSYGSPDPYQLSKDFLYIVAGVFNFNLLFYLTGTVLLLTAILKPNVLSGYSQYLFWFGVIIFGIDFLTIHTNAVSIFNRFQLYRLGFFIATIFAILFGEWLEAVVKNVPRKYCIMAAIAIFAGGLTQAFIYSSVYGYTTTNDLQDPVSVYLEKNSPPTGSIFITDSTTASYNQPNLRYVTGYNDQLLPQHSNVRLAQLLGSTAPNLSVSASDIDLAADYVKVLGVEDIFLPKNSPYIKPLIEAQGFTLKARVSGKSFDQVVLSPPWRAAYAFKIDCQNQSAFVTPAYPLAQDSKNFRVLDGAVQQSATILRSSTSVSLPVTFPAKDAISVQLVKDGSKQCLVLNQSYATNWTSKKTNIKPSSYGMMLLNTRDGSTQSIYLKHSWGHVVQVQALATIIALVAAAKLYNIQTRRFHRA